MRQVSPPTSVGNASLKVPFGLKDGRMWGPNQVAHGKACGCVCPACHTPLVAKAIQSARRRAHFAHLVETDCRAGFETALHLKAKQLIVEQLMLQLPAWDGEQAMPNPPVAIDDAGNRLLGRRVDFPARRSILTEARIEVWRGDYIPDVIAKDECGELLIEIRVSHAVDELKRRRIQSEGARLVEIDLSKLRYEQVCDEERLVHWVLCEPSNRVWLSYPAATEDWRDSHRALKLALAERNQQLAQERQRLEQARAAALDAAAREDASNARRLAARNRFREQERNRYHWHLEDLPALVDSARIQTLLTEYQLRDEADAERLIGDVASASVRTALRTFTGTAWIYEVYPTLWQAAAYHQFVHQRPAGTEFNQREMARWVLQKFGKEPVLYQLFQSQYAARDQARRAGYPQQRIFNPAFTELENRQIPNFYAPVNALVARLIRCGCLEALPEVIGGVRIKAGDVSHDLPVVEKDEARSRVDCEMIATALTMWPSRPTLRAATKTETFVSGALGSQP